MKISIKITLILVVSLLITAIVISSISIMALKKAEKHELSEVKTLLLQSKKETLENVVKGICSVIEGQETKEAAIKIVKEMRYGATGKGYLWINDMSTPYSNMVMHPMAPQLDGKVLNNPKYNCAMGNDQNLFSAMVNVGSRKGQGYVDYKWPKPGAAKGELFDKLSYVKLIKKWDWVIGTGVYIDDIETIVSKKAELLQEDISAQIIKIIISMVFLLIVFILIALFISKRITLPLDNTVSMLKEIAEGDADLTKRLRIKSNDETGELAKWFNTFMEKLQSLIKQTKDGTDLLNNYSSTQSKNISEITNSTESMNSQSMAISVSAEQASSNINNISASTEEMNSSISTVATAIEEMNSTVNEIARNCQKESESAEKANTQAKTTNEMMKKLEASANEIGKVLDVIKDIADQTNLLALNATIEAASAGEAGKGFAVVATEVKELAKQTASATDEIGRQIESMRSSTHSSVKAIEDISIIVEEVNTISATIVSAVEEQSATISEISNNVMGINNASKEVALNVEESAKGIGEISNNITSFNEITTEITNEISVVEKSTDELIVMAKNLDKSVGEFKV